MKKTFISTMFGLLGFGVTASADFATEMIEATFKIFDPAVTGTCFLVRRDASDQKIYLVTAAHMLEGTKADKVTIVLREKSADGTYKRRNHMVVIRRDGKPLWVRHEKDDVAVLRLDEPFPVPAGSVSVNDFADEARLTAAGIHVCSSLFVLTYPTSFEANSAGFPVARQAIVANHPFVPAGKKHAFLADFTAFDGDSGGPVFVAGAEGRPLIVGMVFAQFRSDEKIKTKYEERAIHYPLGLGDVLHARFVRDTIELAARREADKKPAEAPK